MTTDPIGLSGGIPEWELCDALQLSMRKAGMKTGDMAARLGVAPETVSRWVNGKKQPSGPALIAWAALTGVDVRWLEALRACRDSNPKPSDLESRIAARWFGGVKATLTPNRPVHHPACPARHGAGQCAGCGRSVVAS